MLGIIHCDRDGAPAFVFDIMEPERRKVDRASGLRRFAEIAVFDPVAHTSRTGTTSSPAPTADSAPSACRRAEEKKRGREPRPAPFFNAGSRQKRGEQVCEALLRIRGETVERTNNQHDGH